MSDCFFEYDYRWPQFADALLSGDSNRVAEAVSLLEERDRRLEDRLRQPCGGGGGCTSVYGYYLGAERWDNGYRMFPVFENTDDPVPAQEKGLGIIVHATYQVNVPLENEGFIRVRGLPMGGQAGSPQSASGVAFPWNDRFLACAGLTWADWSVESGDYPGLFVIANNLNGTVVDPDSYWPTGHVTYFFSSCGNTEHPYVPPL